ncbi:MAG: hypothetical protein ACE5H3_07495 [Planctomycetota bacterium]
MARRPAKPQRKTPKRASKGPVRPPRERKAARGVPKAASAEPDEAGMPVESVMLLTTGIRLFLAFLLIDIEKGLHYGSGMFFSGLFGG